MSLHSEYVRLIDETDRVLKAKREMWLAAKTDDERRKWRVGLDETLDERFRLMGLRDKAKEGAHE